jgi:hypothetical protein
MSDDGTCQAATVLVDIEIEIEIEIAALRRRGVSRWLESAA